MVGCPVKITLCISIAKPISLFFTNVKKEGGPRQRWVVLIKFFTLSILPKSPVKEFREGDHRRWWRVASAVGGTLKKYLVDKLIFVCYIEIVLFKIAQFSGRRSFVDTHR